MNRTTNVLMVLLALWLSGCVTAPGPDFIKILTIDECAGERQSGSAFNARKSQQLIRHECEQTLMLDSPYRKIENKKFQKNRRLTYSDEQEYFDEQAWSLVIGYIREKYYPAYLSPEKEVVRANRLNEEQKTIKDKSIWRDYQPRLLKVSPYLMNHSELEQAGEAVSSLIYENRENKDLHGSLSVIDVIILKEKQKKDIYLNRY